MVFRFFPSLFANSARIGHGEVDLVDALIKGVAQLVKWATALGAGNEEGMKEIRRHLEHTPLLVKERTVIMNFLIDLMGFEARYALTRHALVLMSARYGHET